MGLNYRVIAKVIGIVSIIISACMLPPLFIALYYGENIAFRGFFLTIFLFFTLGFILVLKVDANTKGKKLGLRDGLLIVALCWIVASLISSTAYVLSGAIPDFVDAFFESTSGFSTTGSTILPDIEAVPKSALFWRSFTQWLGGMGILIFAIALLPAMGIDAFWIATSESPGPVFDKLTPKISDTAKILYIIYIGMSVLQTILLMLCDLSLYDSLVHMFSSMGTGGFSCYNASVGHYDSVAVELIISFFMLAAAVNFNLYYFLLRGRIKQFFKDEELRLFIFIVALFTLLTAILLHFSYPDLGFLQALRQGIFQISSIITTTGFASVDFNLWPNQCQIMLFALMFVGGCATSTAGGIKIVRILIFLKLIKRGISKRLHPMSVKHVKLNGNNLSAEVVASISNYLFFYMVLLFVSAMIVSLDNVDIMTSLSSTVTCLGNVGPGFGAVGPYGSFNVYSKPITFYLGLLMLAGRLELYTLIIIFMPSFWKPTH